jgi:hypothetical protein
VTALLDGATAALCLGTLATFLTRGSAGRISVAHRRPWLRRADLGHDCGQRSDA